MIDIVTSFSFASASIISMKGCYSRLVKEVEQNKKYNSVLFDFKGIEKFFPPEKFITEFENEDSQFKFIKEKTNIISYKLSDKIDCKVLSDFKGMVKSDNLFEPNVKQKKVIVLNFDDTKTKEDIILTIKNSKALF